jgi:hypothetical protein
VVAVTGPNFTCEKPTINDDTPGPPLVGSTVDDAIALNKFDHANAKDSMPTLRPSTAGPL